MLNCAILRQPSKRSGSRLPSPNARADGLLKLWSPRHRRSSLWPPIEQRRRRKCFRARCTACRPFPHFPLSRKRRRCLRRVRTEIEATDALAAPLTEFDCKKLNPVADLPARQYDDWWLSVRDILQRRPARLRDLGQKAVNARDADPQSFSQLRLWPSPREPDDLRRLGSEGADDRCGLKRREAVNERRHTHKPIRVSN